jgi:hypothetical protein
VETGLRGMFEAEEELKRLVGEGQSIHSIGLVWRKFTSLHKVLLPNDKPFYFST